MSQKLMTRPSQKLALAAAVISVVALSAPGLRAQAIGLKTLSDQSKECIECHKKQNLVIYQQWGTSKHYRANVGCYECHAAEKTDPDAMLHYNHVIATIVSPKDCGRCHGKEVEQFAGSHHAKGGRILGSLDNVLADIVEGNRGMKTMGFPEGVSAASVNGCLQCHGSQIKVLPSGKLDPVTYPNSGIGRINPDGSEGSCNACHTRHEFSAAQARHPDTCGKCHLGPDHPQKEIYEESKHGIAFFSHLDQMNLSSPKWVVGEDYWAAPTCATCHMSATRNQEVTHDIGARISWNNRPELSVRPEMSDAKMGLPGKDIPWQVRRQSMKDVCSNCHNTNWVENFYVQYDSLVDLYNEKYAKPGKAIYEKVAKLKEVAAPFSAKIDWIWFELWHHEGRRARHAASMMAPDYTHWHGTYDLAKTFYSHFVPEVQAMIEEGLKSNDAEIVKAASDAKTTLDQVLNSPDHQWFLGKLSPEEKERRAKEREEFLKRYSK